MKNTSRRKKRRHDEDDKEGETDSRIKGHVAECQESKIKEEEEGGGGWWVVGGGGEGE